MSMVMVFDLDDTLFPEHAFVRSGFRAVDAWLTAEAHVSGFFTQAMALFERGLRGRIFDEALVRLGLSADPDRIQQMLEIYRAHRPVLQLFDDARWALEHFRTCARLGLITDGYLVTQRNKVAALGIGAVFETIVYSDSLGREHWKPSARPYEVLMETLRCAAADCVYVADNPQKDFVTARRLGWRTVRIMRPGGEYAGVRPAPGYEADRQIGSLKELE